MERAFLALAIFCVVGLLTVLVLWDRPRKPPITRRPQVPAPLRKPPHADL